MSSKYGSPDDEMDASPASPSDNSDHKKEKEVERIASTSASNGQASSSRSPDWNAMRPPRSAWTRETSRHNTSDESGEDSLVSPTKHMLTNDKVLLVVPSEQAVHEERQAQADNDLEAENDDPYVYSDDSLSDSYFLPKKSDTPKASHFYSLASSPFSKLPFQFAHRKHSSNELTYSEEAYAIQENAKARSYGSLGSLALSVDDESSTPGSTPTASQGNLMEILENAPISPDEETPLVTTATLSRKQLNRQRKLQQKQQTLQQRQIARERIVQRIRGKKQEPPECRDKAFALLFVIQLIMVIYMAVRYGTSLTAPSVHGGHLLSGGSSSSSSSSSPIKFLLGADLYAPSTSSAIHFNSSEATSSGKDMDKLTDDAIPNQVDDDSAGADDHSSSSSKPSTNQSSTTPKTSTAAAMETVQYNPFAIAYKNVLNIMLVSGTFALMFSYLGFVFMLVIVRSLIQIVLISMVLLSCAWGILGLVVLDPYDFISILGFSSFFVSLGYTISCWGRVPFVSTNLYVALCAMRSTADIVLFGMAALLVSFLWCLVWSVSIIGMTNTVNASDCLRDDKCDPYLTERNILEYIFLLLSFFWTSGVLNNIVQVVIASAVGTWWFSPKESSPCFGSTVSKPLGLALTKSLGSICFGSLVACPSQIMSDLLGLCCVRSSERAADSILQELIRSQNKSDPGRRALQRQESNNRAIGYMESLGRTLQCYNDYGFTYIGLYGYGYAQGGESALQLFEVREWTEIAMDNLIHNVLTIGSIVIGGTTGVFAVVVEEVDGFEFSTLQQPILTAFLIGFVLGFVLSRTLLSMVGSAVNTVLVCFAAGPFEFEKNHPRHSREMREVWSQQVWEPAP